MIKITATVRTGRLASLSASASNLKSSSSPEWDGVRAQWTRRYSAWLKRRYLRLSRGGGEWPPLAASTVRGRRGPAPGGGRAAGTGRRPRAAGAGRGGRSVAILVDTRRLINALDVGADGNLVRAVPGGVEFGIVGGSHGARGPSIGRIASWHQRGAGNLPVRRIIVPPDATLQRQMAGDMARALGLRGGAA